jgi:ABC-2 type transport system ATP-binding protein
MQTLLKVRNIKKNYLNHKKEIKKALIDVSFDLYKGEILGLLGVNGAGKTTLSSIIASLHPPTLGEILWEDVSIYKRLYEYRKIIGFCPQKQNLDLNLTIEQNLIMQGRFFGLPKGLIEKNKESLLEKFSLKEYAKEKADVLSGGYKQRFLIARTLMHNPKFVIFDEPTVGLDPNIRQKLLTYISSLKEEGVTVILTTHYLEEAEKISDRVCFIDSGKIMVIDTPEKLKNDLQKKSLEEVFLHLTKGEEENES